jgi:hypothetical protein
MILLLTSISFLLLPFSTLLPVVAKDVFQGNATTFGLLNGINGLEAQVGAFNLAVIKPGKAINRVVIYATMVFEISLLLFAGTTYLLLTLLFMTFTGFGMMTFIAGGNIFIQTHVEE